MKYTIVFLFLTIIGYSCTKIGVVDPAFNVSSEKTTYAVGEKVRFNIEGNPDLITFFSGEPLNDYAYKDGRIVPSDKLLASFSTGIAYGTQPDLLSVWISNDFSGIYTIEEVLKATWSNDLTKNFTLAPNSMNSTSSSQSVPSGTLDLLPAIDKTKDLYFAYRYYKLPDSIAGTQRNWFVRSTSILLSTFLGTSQVSTTSNFTLVYDEHFTDPALKNSSVGSTSMTIRAPNAVGADTVQVWSISNPIKVGDVDFGPDRGTPIKGFTSDVIRSYEYVFDKPGTYNVAFVAKNANVYGESADVVIQIPINITE